MKTLVRVRRYLLRPPHWSSLAIASLFGIVAGIADHSLLSIFVSALICFWLLHSAGKFGSCLPIGFLANDYYGPLQWFKPGPHHLMGITEWLTVLQFMCAIIWFVVGLVVIPGLFGEFIDSLAARRNNEFSHRFLFALLILPYTILLILPVIIFGGLDK